VFEAKEGWEPLCRFLGVKMPAVPYPNMNTTEEFLERRRAMQAVAKS
jgi:Sulfotransferase domain